MPKINVIGSVLAAIRPRIAFPLRMSFQIEEGVLVGMFDVMAFTRRPRKKPPSESIGKKARCCSGERPPVVHW
tara:strand:- start:42293 stop:42511 length:219 start_codon:yes stop_codon:yes gene_type:complete